MKNIGLHVKAFLFTLVLGLPQYAWTQGLRDAASQVDKTAVKAGVEDKGDLALLIGDIIQGALGLVGLIFFALMVYAGFYWMTARGDESRIEKAKESIKAAIIGLIVVVSAYAITTFVTERLSN